jgi:hypothetical protein
MSFKGRQGRITSGGEVHPAEQTRRVVRKKLRWDEMIKYDVSRILRGHQANLDRYASLLATNLTEFERQYIPSANRRGTRRPVKAGSPRVYHESFRDSRPSYLGSGPPGSATRTKAWWGTTCGAFLKAHLRNDR